MTVGEVDRVAQVLDDAYNVELNGEVEEKPYPIEYGIWRCQGGKGRRSGRVMDIARFKVPLTQRN